TTSAAQATPPTEGKKTKTGAARQSPPDRAKNKPYPAEQAHNPIAPPGNLCFTFRQTHKKEPQKQQTRSTLIGPHEQAAEGRKKQRSGFTP
ncbi:hypothetical protein PQR72_09950, partial [Paraburkholderia madseniana]